MTSQVKTGTGQLIDNHPPHPASGCRAAGPGASAAPGAPAAAAPAAPAAAAPSDTRPPRAPARSAGPRAAAAPAAPSVTRPPRAPARPAARRAPAPPRGGRARRDEMPLPVRPSGVSGARSATTEWRGC
jgi:hypothetical protein